MELKLKLIALEEDLKEDKEVMFAINSSMTSQYKAMQEKLTKRKIELE